MILQKSRKRLLTFMFLTVATRYVLRYWRGKP